VPSSICLIIKSSVPLAPMLTTDGDEEDREDDGDDKDNGKD
jgi:hypothetical protein